MPGADDPLLTVALAELDRAWTELSTTDEPPYWMGLGLLDRRTVEVEATHGAAGAVRANHHRLGDVDLRVGSMELDNTHKLRDAGYFSEPARPSLVLPTASSPAYATRLEIWKTIDASYRSAVRRLIKVRTNEVVKVEREDTSADFSEAPVVVDLRELPPLQVDGALWQDRVRDASALMLEYGAVYDSNVSFRAQDDTHYFLDSAGSQVRHRRYRMRVSVWASTVADDGMQLDFYDWIDAADLDALPDDQALEKMVRHTGQRLTELREAPLVDPYVGPAILRGRAAAVFFHEILGHRIEGHRQKDEDEGQTFTDKVGEQILPAFLSVHDDPTVKQWQGTDLNGAYPYDDEGVASQRVTVVDRGVLRNFLLGRAPIAGFPVSNGHGRRQPGAAPVARQGNLFVSADEAVEFEALRQQLIDLIIQQDKPFGLIFDDISGGFTFTGRVTPNAFNVRPVTVWKVFPDGRPDQLVRGVDMIGTPLTTFSRILAASEDYQVFNGMCGAESGWVPVSAIAPDLLVSEIEVQRKEKENDRPPLLSPPGALAPATPGDGA